MCGDISTSARHNVNFMYLKLENVQVVLSAEKVVDEQMHQNGSQMLFLVLYDIHLNILGFWSVFTTKTRYLK